LPLIIFAVLIVIAVYVVAVYNDLVTMRTRIKASIQEIGNQLKRQAELIPNLETSAKSYLKHEKDIIKLIADARKSVTEAVASGNLDQMAQAGEKIAGLLPQIRVAVESNPEIKGAEVVGKLMDELRDTSDKVMYARRTLIDLTADFNVKIVAFPSNLIANLFGFAPEKGLATPDSGAHLEVSDADIKTPKLSL